MQEETTAQKQMQTILKLTSDKTKCGLVTFYYTSIETEGKIPKLTWETTTTMVNNSLHSNLIIR